MVMDKMHARARYDRMNLRNPGEFLLTCQRFFEEAHVRL